MERIRFQILCEDKNHYYFCKAFIENMLGKHNAFCRRVDVPLGKGAGEQKVREKYPIELKAIRSRPASENNWLVVLIDADNKTIEGRRQQLPAEDNDKVVRIIPKKNIETWFEWLNHGEACEDNNYKMRHQGAKPTNYGKKLAEIAKKENCKNVISSLQAACDEWAIFKARIKN